jgi:glutathione synthase/RimK-type ligase-like ATP-grasp enzyme
MQPNPIVIVAPEADDHAKHLGVTLARLSLPYSVQALQPPEDAVPGFYPETGASFFHSMCGLSAQDNITVWWRRPGKLRTPVISAESEWFTYIHNQWRALLSSHLACARCVCVNPVEAERRALLKPYQLFVAGQIGLSVPRTVVTNTVSTARAFIDGLAREGKRCVVKPLTSGSGLTAAWAETRVIDLNGLNTFGDSLKVAPVIFQECIERGTDLRITIFGKSVFCARITDTAESAIDWRIDPRSSYEPTPVSDSLTTKLLELLNKLGLVTGSFDLRIGRDGEVYFFEVNPSGQFLYLEYFGFPDIAERFARYLAFPSQPLSS